MLSKAKLEDPSAVVAELELLAQMACDLGTAQDGELYMAAAQAVRRMQSQVNKISAVADIVDRNLGLEPDRSTPVDLRISHQLCGLLEALTRQKQEGK